MTLTVEQQFQLKRLELESQNYSREQLQQALLEAATLAFESQNSAKELIKQQLIPNLDKNKNTH